MKKVNTVILLALILLRGCKNNSCSIKDETRLTKNTYCSADKKY
ncbi:MAG: hypothetical protein PUC07_03610 [Solobacterium sp.]|nr:hypothetical protein [Solobacterium sp.]